MKNYDRLLAWMISLITVIGVFLWRQYCHLDADDYLYRMAVPDDVGGDDFMSFLWFRDSEDLTLAGFPRTVVAHFMYYNARLSNVLAMLAIMLPQWLRQAVCALIICTMFFMALRVAFGRGCFTARRVFLVTLGSWLFYTWQIHMQAVCYVFNYPLPTVVVALFILLEKRLDDMSSVGKTVFLIFSLFLGWLHEGFAIPMCAWLFTVIVIRRKFDLWRLASLTAIICGGFCIAFIGISERTEKMFGGLSHLVELWSMKNADIFVLLVYAVPTLLLALWYCRRNGRTAVVRTLPAVMAFLASMAMCLVFNRFERAFWCGRFFSLIIVARSIDCYLSGCDSRTWRIAGYSFLAVFSGFYSWWMSRLCEVQRNGYEIFSSIERSLAPRYSRTPVDVILLPEGADVSCPDYLMDIPKHRYLDLSNFILPTFAAYWMGTNRLFILPHGVYHPFSPERRLMGNAEMYSLTGQWLVRRPGPNRFYRVEGSEIGPGGLFSNRVYTGIKEIFKGHQNIKYSQEWLRWAVTFPDSSEAYIVELGYSPTFDAREVVRIDSLANPDDITEVPVIGGK